MGGVDSDLVRPYSDFCSDIRLRWGQFEGVFGFDQTCPHFHFLSHSDIRPRWGRNGDG